jgi:hypothetical protein
MCLKLLIGAVGFVVGAGILPAAPENLALVGAVLILVLLPVCRAL